MQSPFGPLPPIHARSTEQDSRLPVLLSAAPSTDLPQRSAEGVERRRIAVDIKKRLLLFCSGPIMMASGGVCQKERVQLADTKHEVC